MNAIETIVKADSFSVESFVRSVNSSQVERALSREHITIEDFCALLSPAASDFLEQMAQTSAMLTRRHFGGSVLLFAPLYIANLCENCCPYCSFARQHTVSRRQLTSQETISESDSIAATGIRHILVLTGEARRVTTFEYVREQLGLITSRFASTGIEMYPMTENEYRILAEDGVDSLTIYQETYDAPRYKVLHEGGPKADYLFRVDACDRACRAGMRAVNIGALLGLSENIREMYRLAIHTQYLIDTYPEVEIGLSFPRIRPLAGQFTVPFPVDERYLSQIVMAFRLLFPHVGITMSTRESREFRNGMVPIAVTKVSAGVSTAVGGYSDSTEIENGQFEISDDRTVSQMQEDLRNMGFQPITCDWHRSLVRS
jgi:2-iminoacetate synthase